MNDRSVQAGTISQSVVVTGDGNTVVLRIGKADDITVLERKHFPRPERRQPLVPDQRQRALDLLKPEAGKFHFFGRDDLLAELRAWLDRETDISVHALTGRAGTGKTRLAIELCKVVDSDPTGKGKWIAGFLSPGFEEKLATDSFAWERSTLLVIDDAAQRSSNLGRWLNRLANNQKLETKLRLLLLDREAPEGFGWWHELTKEQEARFDLFYAPRPTKLRSLSRVEDRRKVVAAALEAACALRPLPPPVPVIPAAGEDANFDVRLADRQFGNPLALVMAGVIARDSGPRAALALRRLDAARHLARRELDRLAALAESREKLSGDTMRYIVAFNGLAGGLPFEGLRKTLADELLASQRTANLDVLLELLQQEFPIDAKRPAEHRRLATTQPDLIGEAAIIEAFTGSLATEAEAANAVRRAYALGPDMAAQALVRLVQDFAYAVVDKSATEAEKKTGEQVMDWLVILGREIENPVQLIPLVEALPHETIVLREAGVELTERLATFFHQEAKRGNDPAALMRAAGWSNDLGIRLSDLGRREEALAAAEEAVGLYRALAEARPDAFTPHLALSLNNFANRLSGLGRREEALTSSEEAVRLYRALAEARPDAFTPGLAVSLNNLADILRDLGRREEALAAAEEAVRLYRALAEARPDALTPGLAPSLTNLANSLGALGRREDALAAGEEAVRLYRALAEARPDAFTPDLALSLNNLATRLSNLGRRGEALAAAEEAVRLRRALADARPDAFIPDLATSLGALGYVYEQGNPELALSAWLEGIERLTPMFVAIPAAVHHLMSNLVNDYVTQCEALGKVPDEALLAPVLEVFEQLKTQGGQT